MACAAWSNLNHSLTVSVLYWCPSHSQNVVTVFGTLKLHLSSWYLVLQVHYMFWHCIWCHVGTTSHKYHWHDENKSLVGHYLLGFFSLKMKMSGLLKRKKYLEEILEKNPVYDWMLLTSQIGRKLYGLFSSVQY